MFDIGGTELLIVGVVALIVVGPKDLPVMFRNVGNFVGRMRGMAREFTNAMEDAADESGVKDAAKSLRSLTNPAGSAMDAVKTDISKAFSMDDIDPTSETGKLAAERKKVSAQMQAKAARATAERKAKEAAEALAKAEELEAAQTEAAQDAPPTLIPDPDAPKPLDPKAPE